MVVFKIGDVVTLKSGSALKTVEAVNGDTVVCVWDDEKGHKTKGDYLLGTLQIYNPDGVIELKINGSPAFRCVYIAKFENTVFVLHSFEKTTNEVDKKAMETLLDRYKELKIELKNLK